MSVTSEKQRFDITRTKYWRITKERTTEPSAENLCQTRPEKRDGHAVRTYTTAKRVLNNLGHLDGLRTYYFNIYYFPYSVAHSQYVTC